MVRRGEGDTIRESRALPGWRDGVVVDPDPSPRKISPVPDLRSCKCGLIGK